MGDFHFSYFILFTYYLKLFFSWSKWKKTGRSGTNKGDPEKMVEKNFKPGRNINMIINQGEKIKEDELRAMAG